MTGPILTDSEHLVFVARARNPDGSRITVDQWAERHRVVESGPMRGLWSNSVTPYCVLPMRMWTVPWVRKIVLRWAPQTGKTQVGFNCLCYSADMDPAPAMYVMPDERVARRISRRRMLPMFKASPKIRRILGPQRGDQTILGVTFINGMDVLLAWATSAAELASESIRYLIFDETDKYPPFSGREADPLALGEIRTRAWPHNSKLLYISTPTTDAGAISRAIEHDCDVAYKYHVPCPECEHWQTMTDRNIKWPAEVRDQRVMRRKKLARYQCEKCGALWDDHQRNLAVEAGEWRTDNPVDRPRAVGFDLPSWYSRFVSLSEVAAAFMESHDDPARFMTYVTQHRAEPWVHVTVRASAEGVLAARCDLKPQVVPQEAVALTAGIDCQANGFWFVVRAWAADYSSWLIHYGFLPDWEDVETLLFDTSYPVHDHQEKRVRVWRAALDTGGTEVTGAGGVSMTETAYWWLRKNGVGRGCRVRGTKGSSHPMAGQKIRIGKPLDKTPSGRPMPGGLQIVMLDTDQLKDSVTHSMSAAVDGGPRPAYLHSGTGLDYAAQILAEEKRRDRLGKEKWVAVKADNHLFDCEVMAFACADPEWPGGGVNLLAKLKDPAMLVKTEAQRQSASAKPERKRSGWLAGIENLGG